MNAALCNLRYVRLRKTFTYLLWVKCLLTATSVSAIVLAQHTQLSTGAICQLLLMSSISTVFHSQTDNMQEDILFCHHPCSLLFYLFNE